MGNLVEGLRRNIHGKFQKEMLFKDISIFGSGGHSIQWSRTTWAIVWACLNSLEINLSAMAHHRPKTGIVLGAAVCPQTLPFSSKPKMA